MLTFAHSDGMKEKLFSKTKCPKCDGKGFVACVQGLALRELRIKAGVSLRKFAKKLSFSAAYLSDIERGRRNCSNAILEAYQQL
jgi:DNA-binding transcriptional regulator YiaG